MAQVLQPQRKSNSQLYSGAAQQAASALPDKGLISGPLLGGMAGKAGMKDQVTGVQVNPVEIPQAGAVPETQLPEQAPMVNQNEALQRRLAMLNQISAQSQQMG